MFVVVICPLFCVALFFVFVSVFVFFWDISLSTYVIEAVEFSDPSMILVNLWKT